MGIEETFKEFIIGEMVRIDNGVYVRIDIFKKIFKDAKTYEDFMRIDNGEKGYKKFLDKCREEGILK